MVIDLHNFALNDSKALWILLKECYGCVETRLRWALVLKFVWKALLELAKLRRASIGDRMRGIIMFLKGLCFWVERAVGIGWHCRSWPRVIQAAHIFLVVFTCHWATTWHQRHFYSTGCLHAPDPLSTTKKVFNSLLGYFNSSERARFRGLGDFLIKN